MSSAPSVAVAEAAAVGGMPGRSFRDDAVRLVLLAAYMALIGYAGVNHAMWRDEMQAWLIARDSDDLIQLFHNLRYEGHPGLWHTLLFVLSRLGPDPNLMLALNFVLMSTAMALVLWYLPLLPWERLLFPFGYFMVFEYGVKARSYGLGTLLVVLLCVAWPARRHRPLTLALLLALIANTHVLFFILSVGAAGGLLVEWLRAKPKGRRIEPVGIVSAVVLLAGWLFAIRTFVPEADSGFAAIWYFSYSADRMSKAFLGFSGLLGNSGIEWLGPVAVLVIAATGWSLRRQSAPLILLLVSFAGITAFFYVKYAGFVWSHGVLFLAFLAAVWAARSDSSARMGRTDRALLSACVTVVLGFQLYFGIAAYRRELAQPYSNGKAVAAFIAAKGWAGGPIIGMPDSTMAPVIGYLGADRFYFVEGHRWGSFVLWDSRRRKPANLEAALRRFADPDRPALFISGAAPDSGILARHGFVEVARFDGAVWENYVVYRRSPSRDP